MWIRGLAYDWRWSKTVGDNPNRTLRYRLSWFWALRGYRR